MNRIKTVSKYFLCILLVAFALGCTKQTIKVGQIWKYTYNDNNPYEKVTVHYFEVIEIIGEYVLYIKNKKDTLHSKKYWFVVGSKCITNCN